MTLNDWLTTSVIVHQPFGTVSYARSTADEFERGVLTITRSDTPNEPDELKPKFQRWQWLSADVFSGKSPDFTLTNEHFSFDEMPDYWKSVLHRPAFARYEKKKEPAA